MPFVVVLSLMYSRRAESERATTEIVDLHVATLASANPVDVVSGDRHTVKPWFQGKAPFSFNLPEFSGTQFKVVGGKIAYVENHVAAQLLLGSGKHEISVFIAQDRPGDFPAAPAGGAAREGIQHRNVDSRRLALDCRQRYERRRTSDACRAL